MASNGTFKAYGIFSSSALLLLLSLLTPPPTYSEEGTITFQGVIMTSGEPSSYIVVNEGKVLVTEATRYLNHKEKTISSNEFRAGKWVFGVAHTTLRGLTADKLYLLPKKVKGDKDAEYPFMTREDEEDLAK
jgi:hypothetical protein